MDNVIDFPSGEGLEISDIIELLTITSDNELSAELSKLIADDLQEWFMFSDKLPHEKDALILATLANAYKIYHKGIVSNDCE
jgi:formate dehydrogenase maturation protein FdhE